MTAVALLVVGACAHGAAIDRHALVSRHNVVLTAFEGERPLQVGNGEFAFGMDITGLQSFVPFNTMSQWGWHTGYPPEPISNYKLQIWDTHGRPVLYPSPDPQHPVISNWLASSPHRINLGRFGMRLLLKDGREARPEDLTKIRQELNLWTGIVTTRFELEGSPVTVKTACHPKVDSVGAHIESPLISEGRLTLFVTAPGNNPVQFANFVGDWANPGKLEPESPASSNSAEFKRNIDELDYYIGLRWSGGARLQMPSEAEMPLEIIKAEYGGANTWVDVTDLVSKAVSKGRLNLPVGNNLAPDPIRGVRKSVKLRYRAAGAEQTTEVIEGNSIILDGNPDRHRVVLKPSGKSISVSCTYSLKPNAGQDAVETLAASRRSWPEYWKGGGALDLSGSTDPRWKELERRVVLSQYLMAVNEAGSNPPQESGLVNNGWYGRFHMEMVWWQAAHWALWKRWPQANPSLEIYDRILPQSKALAKSQGYEGARWPKCIGPDGREWPHEIHAFLLWQQPHPIFFAELDYRANPTPATLKKWQPVVEATADFMATYAFLDKQTGKYVLGPPLHLVSENVDPKVAKNPTFELGYWRFGLRTAQEWRKRMALPPKAKWDSLLKSLAPLPTQDGLYVLHEGVQDMWTKWNFEHPAISGAYGLLPGDGVDRATMRRTLDKISQVWQFDKTWGWDFPMLAMCAARLGDPDRAIDFLMTSAAGFQFDERGLATGGPFPYFPSNGGLLYAVAMMAAGWDGAPKTHAPGFPTNGKWKVRFEGLVSAP